MYQDLYSKALRFAQDARNALDEGGGDSAVNRAYYAMFNAARAFLDSQGLSIEAASHGAVVQLFGLHAIKPGKIEPEYGRQLIRAMEARSIADYDGESVPPADARVHVDAAEKFVVRIAALLPSLPQRTRIGPSASAHAELDLLRILAQTFCRATRARGFSPPDGLEEQLVATGSREGLTKLIVDMNEMTDLAAFLAQRFPNIRG